MAIRWRNINLLRPGIGRHLTHIMVDGRVRQAPWLVLCRETNSLKDHLASKKSRCEPLQKTLKMGRSGFVIDAADGRFGLRHTDEGVTGYGDESMGYA